MAKSYTLIYFEVTDLNVDTMCLFKTSAVMPSTWSAERLNKGFWVNKDYEVTDGQDAEYWVAPSSIIGARKVQQDDE